MDKYLKHIFGLFAGLVCLVIYILTLNPSVTFIDSGELAAVVYTFGVPHPTGYPLFLIIGYIVSHLPLPGSVIYRLNMLSAVESAAAVVVTYYSALILIESVFNILMNTKAKKQINKKNKKSENTETEDPHKKSIISVYSLVICLLGFFTAICTGLTKTFWFGATQIEVYALHSLFISLIIFYSIRILVNINVPVRKNWVMLFILLGLSAANHSTTIYFIPALLYLFYLQYSSDKLYAKKLIPLGALMIPGLLLYAVLIISSSAFPYLNWSDVQNISNLPGHLRGSDFSQLMFSSTSRFSENASTFFKGLPGEFAIIPLAFSVAGFLFLWKTFKNFVIYIILCFIFTLLYSFNYNTVEINSFYLLVFYLISLILPIGVVYLISFGSPQTIFTGKNEPKNSTVKIVIVGLILSIFSAAYNYKENDNSSNYANVDFTVNTLNSLPDNSILVSYEWAYIYSSSLYFQLVEKLRPDVKVFNIKFLSAPWYLNTISKYYPDVYENIKPEADEYLKVYDKDEKIIVPKLTALVKAFIDKCSAKFPVYFTIDMVFNKEMKQFFANYILKPTGFVYKIEPKNSPYDNSAGVNTLNSTFRKFEPISKHKATMFKVIPGMYFETAYYHYNNKNIELSLKFIDKALEFDPAFTDALKLKSKITSELKK